MAPTKRPVAVAFSDEDIYNARTSEFLFRFHPNAIDRMSFISRAKDLCIPNFINLGELNALLESIRTVAATPEELAFLEKEGHSREYLNFLAGMTELPPLRAEADGNSFSIEPQGTVTINGFWETRILRAVSYLFFKAQLERSGLTEEEVFDHGELILRAKCEKVAMHPKKPKVIEFGTRRCPSHIWHDRALRILIEILGNQLVGTSNMYLARKYGLKAIGTMPHRVDQIYQGVYYEEDNKACRLVSHEMMLDDWYNYWGKRLSITLPDTYGFEYFYRTFGAERGRNWIGHRQDSGPPRKFVEKNLLPFCSSIGVDPRNKICVFSDNLRLGGDLMFELADLYTDTFDAVNFGIGTNITNDLGFPSLPIVVKSTLVNNHGVGKLTGNIEKAVGNKDTVERLKGLTGYNETYRETCTY